MPDFLENKRVWLAGLGILLVLIFWAGTKYGAYNSKNAQTEVILSDKSPTELSEAESSKEIQVYVNGKVNKPGVYILEEGARVYQAIEAAGGAAEGADVETINMAAVVKDGANVTVGTPGETNVQNSSNRANGSIYSSNYHNGGLININTAGLAELEQLNGIGPALAQRIIDYRETNGSFGDINELLKVNGIGAKKFEQIQDKICVN